MYSVSDFTEIEQKCKRPLEGLTNTG